MKKLFLLLAVALLAFSCTKKQGQLVPVHVAVNTFEISQGDINSRGEVPVADYNGIKKVTLAFYKSDGTEQYKVTQVKNDPSTFTTTFGDFDLSLPMNNYTMVVIGYSTIDGSPFELTSPTSAAYTGEHALETFAATQAVNVTSTNDLDISATLNRVVSKLQVISADGRTANASNISITLTGGSRSFNPTTGLASDDDGFINTVGISAAEGSPSTSTTFLFLYTDEETMDVTVDVLDSDGNSISHNLVENVPLQRNHLTRMTGSIYTADGSAGFTVETPWGDTINVNF